jgi:hypothetical protein
MQKALKYGAVLIGAYIAVANATGFGKVITSLTGLGVGVTKTLQGR